MTKFIDGSKKSEPKKQVKETVFTHFVNSLKEIQECKQNASDFENVEFLFSDKSYGDVFVVFSDNEHDEKTIMFGTKGDEDYG